MPEAVLDHGLPDPRLSQTYLSWYLPSFGERSKPMIQEMAALLYLPQTRVHIMASALQGRLPLLLLLHRPPQTRL